MRRAVFLRKLKSEGKLLVVEPSAEVSNAYIIKSESHLKAAKLLFEHDFLEESVSIAYYSIYHMLTSLLLMVGIRCENHTGSILLLKTVFSMSNKAVLQAKKERIDKQYHIEIPITKEEVKDFLRTAGGFRRTMYDFISRLNSERIEKYRWKLKNILRDS